MRVCPLFPAPYLYPSDTEQTDATWVGTVYDSSKVELLELLFPPEMRQRLPNGGWRKVPLRILIALLRSGAIVVAEEETSW